MAQPLLYDRVMETTTTTGTGTYTLAGAVTGYQTFAVVGTGITTPYVAWAVDASGVPTGDWEVGSGVYTTSGTTLTRVTIKSSSNAGAAVNWGAGTKRIAQSLDANAAVTTDVRGASGDAPTFATAEIKGNFAIKGPKPYVDVMSTGLTRLAAASLTTTLGTITNGTNALTVASATGWLVGHGVWLILDGGVTTFSSYVTAINGLVLTLNDNATGTASGSATNVVYHDDTLAIQDAIDFGSSQSKAQLPGGTFYVSSVKLRQTIPLDGAGLGSTVLFSLPGNTATAMVMLFSATTNNTQIRNLTINGNRSATPAPTCGGISFTGTALAFSRHQVMNTRITNCAGDGIDLTNILYSHFTDVMIDVCYGHGIKEFAGCFFNTYTNIHIAASGLNGVHLLGDADLFTNLWVNGSGFVSAVAPYGANIYLGSGSHGHTFAGFWVAEAYRTNIDLDAAGGGSMNMTGTSHQNLAAEHLTITDATDCRIMMTAVPGVTALATSLLNASALSIRNYIDVIYRLDTIAPNVPPAIGAGLTGKDNFIRLVNGSKFGSGDINVFDSEPLYVSQEWTRNTPTTLWRYPGGMVYRQPG